MCNFVKMCMETFIWVGGVVWEWDVYLGGGGGGKGARGRRGNRINIVSENYHED